MAKIQCKMCGGLNDLPDGVTSGECQYCGCLTTFPKIADEQTERLYARAEHFRQTSSFDKAVSIYESILAQNGEDPEAYWGLLISKYGIEYVEDPATHERIPTCHRVQFDSILADEDYQNALNFAAAPERAIYEKEAARIAEIQKNILRISAQEKPYDVFICYKETTDGGTRTKDSTLAQDIYYQLTNQGLKVFFSRITLEDKLGQQYEPYIFAALNSSKVMLVIGSKKEYFEAVWVKNEWSRFLAIMKKDSSKLLIPCYRDMDPYDIPEELSMFQCQDMGKIGFIQDILRGVMKVVNAGKTDPATPSSGASRTDANSDIAKMRKRISILMLQNDWDEARNYCKKALDLDPENAELYLMLCMIDCRLPGEDALRKARIVLSYNKNFQVALKLAPAERRKQLEEIQALTASNFHLGKCVEANRVSAEADLVSILVPLAYDENFKKALNTAPPERKKELERIQADQTDNFLRLCMERNHVFVEADLAHAPNLLATDNYYQFALQNASPDRKKGLERILAEQAEYMPELYLKRCMESHRVSSEADLAHVKKPLVKDNYFNLAMSSASQERKAQLRAILTEQPIFFLQRCMTANHVSSLEDLVSVKNRLSQDRDFQLALDCTSGSELYTRLVDIQQRQEKRLIREKNLKNLIIIGSIIVLTIAVIVISSAVSSCRKRRAEEARRTEQARQEELKAEEARRTDEFLKQIASDGVSLPRGVDLKMVMVEAGTFEMGSDDAERSDDEMSHYVSLRHVFCIGRTEVTQAQWKAVMGNSPSLYKGDDLPVECVSWDDAQAFCRRLNSLYAGKKPAGYKFDLPTEAQWEYAARGGRKSRGCKYSGSDSIDSVAWYSSNSAGKTHPVGTKQPNALGLYDMSGNVWEWCRDRYEKGYANDPEFLQENHGSHSVYRGGAWSGVAGGCRVARRDYFTPGSRRDDLGFRLALVPVQ